MTKKDYEKIAKAVEKAVMHNNLFRGGDYGKATLEGIDLTANYVADVMQADNPRFNRSLFLKACGVI